LDRIEAQTKMAEEQSDRILAQAKMIQEIEKQKIEKEKEKKVNAEEKIQHERQEAKRDKFMDQVATQKRQDTANDNRERMLKRIEKREEDAEKMLANLQNLSIQGQEIQLEKYQGKKTRLLSAEKRIQWGGSDTVPPPNPYIEVVDTVPPKTPTTPIRRLSRSIIDPVIEKAKLVGPETLSERKVFASLI
jgi:hypothetical protein